MARISKLCLLHKDYSIAPLASVGFGRQIFTSQQNVPISNSLFAPKQQKIGVRRKTTDGCVYKETERITPLEESRKFMINCLEAVGTCKENAEIVAENLLLANHRGHYSHGLNRLERYLKDIIEKRVDSNSKPCIEKQNVATALVNGNNGMGAVVGKFCMNLAIEKAFKVGVGIVSARNSNHCGITSIYTLSAVEKGLLGISFTNTSPLLVPTRAKDAALGTNPISMAAPALNGDSFVLDIATTAVALGKIELAKRKQQPLPEGWALNEKGEVETNAEKAYNAFRLLPLGGTEAHSGYKGFGLAMMVEIMCGILAGSNYGPNIPKWGKQSGLSNLGHCFIAINPKCFAGCFEERMSDLNDTIRKMIPADTSKPVMVAGDAERLHMALVEKRGGLVYVQNQHDSNAKLAKELNVPDMVSCNISK